MAADKLRVGLIGANATVGWSPRSHIPALLGLPDLELAAICTAHEDTAKESARKFGVELAFHNHLDMLESAEIDAVGVSVRVPDHYRLTMAALEAGKHVYTEWPLGANLEEAEELAEVAEARGVKTMVGLQARCSPVFLRIKELLEEGYVGEVLSCRMAQIGSGILARPSGRTWQRDVSLGANTFTISFGHIVDSMCMCLGEFREVSSVVSTQVPEWLETDTGRTVGVTSPDHVVVNDLLESGAAVSAHVASVPYHGRDYRLEIYGRDGTIVAESNEHPQLGGMRLLGGRAADQGLRELAVPDRLMWVPDSIPSGPPYNVAQMWSRFADAIRTGKSAEPDFRLAVTRHRLLAAVQRASDTGVRQSV